MSYEGLQKIPRSLLSTASSSIIPNELTALSVSTEGQNCDVHPGMVSGSLCLQIAGRAGYMSDGRLFRTAIGCVTPGALNHNPRLKSLRQTFFGSDVGCSRRWDYKSFETHLRATYSTAIAYHCSNILREPNKDVSWWSDASRIQLVEGCLYQFPGTVHIWATTMDLQALFFAEQEANLPYLHRAYPVSVKSKEASHPSTHSLQTLTTHGSNLD
jgi:hypothetical protein